MEKIRYRDLSGWLKAGIILLIIAVAYLFFWVYQLESLLNLVIELQGLTQDWMESATTLFELLV